MNPRYLRYISAIFFASAALGVAPEFRVETVPVGAGAELLTVFANVPDRAEPVPMLSVVRDTLGDRDPSNDRLRYVWVLTTTEPSLLQRAAAAVPFFYFRAPLDKKSDRTPKPVIDLGDTSTIVWSSLAQQIMQVAAVDPISLYVRASSRRYRTNVSDRRRTLLMQGYTVLSQLDDASIGDDELMEMQARLQLAGQSLGGLVTARKLPDAYFTQRTRREEMRGHNWELLRQRAEANGLYFEPMGVGLPTHAMLWIARDDAYDTTHPFNDKFLGIANPYTDMRVREWDGVTSERDGRELVPLALYSLTYPKVPLLLIDFRNTFAPRRREMIARALTDTVTGLIGYSKWGNWPYMAGSFLFNFTITRRGSATNGAARLNAYAEVQRWLALDGSMAAPLRQGLLHRLASLGVNPLENGTFREFEVARRQYEALRAYAADPRGLSARIEAYRAAELTAYEHKPIARAGLTLARIATLGLYHHRESAAGDGLRQALSAKRTGAAPTPPVAGQ
jgi:hypothetical protein